MTTAARHFDEETCSDCGATIRCGSGRYNVDFDHRRVRGDRIEIDHAATVVILCPRCSLRYDLTRLDVPTADGWYSHEPLSDSPTDQCVACQHTFAEGESFQAAQLAAMDMPSEADGPLVTVSLCETCARQRSLPDAVPPSNDAPPYCYQCGAYTGYTGGIFDCPVLYVAHPTAWRDAAPAKKVRLCHACVTGDCEH
jgi:hypothetical protein